MIPGSLEWLRASGLRSHHLGIKILPMTPEIISPHSPPLRTSSHEVTRKLLYTTEVKSGGQVEVKPPPQLPSSSSTSGSYHYYHHHQQHRPPQHYDHPRHAFLHTAAPPMQVSNGSSGSGRHHHRSHRSKRIRNRSLEMVLDERSPPCCMQPYEAGPGSGARSNRFDDWIIYRMIFSHTRLLHSCKTDASVLLQSSERQLLEEPGAAQAQEI